MIHMPLYAILRFQKCKTGGVACRDRHNERKKVEYKSNPNIDLVKGVIQLIDSRAGITKDDRMMLEWMNATGMYYIIVITKIDKLNKTDRAACIEKITHDPVINPDTKIIPFSSLKGEGKTELWKEISTCAGIK